MSTLSTFFFSAGCILRAVWELACYALRFCWAMVLPKARVAGRLLAAESQLAVELSGSGRRKKQRRQFTAAFRVLWVVISQLLDGWEDLVHVVQPGTVKRWHTKAFGLFWRWRSRPGRPPASSEMQQLIRRLSRENALWGPDRIRDTLLLLGYDAPCTQTICKYMVKPRKPRSPSTTWLPFLRNLCTPIILSGAPGAFRSPEYRWYPAPQCVCRADVRPSRLCRGTGVLDP